MVPELADLARAGGVRDRTSGEGLHPQPVKKPTLGARSTATPMVRLGFGLQDKGRVCCRDRAGMGVERGGVIMCLIYEGLWSEVTPTAVSTTILSPLKRREGVETPLQRLGVGGGLSWHELTHEVLDSQHVFPSDHWRTGAITKSSNCCGVRNNGSASRGQGHGGQSPLATVIISCKETGGF